MLITASAHSCVCAVAACYAPEVMFTGGTTVVGQLLKYTWAPGFLLCAVVCYVLKDAADRGRLGASTFKRLNFGLAALEAGYLLLCVYSVSRGLMVSDASSWSNMAGSAVIALYSLGQGLFAKKK